MLRNLRQRFGSRSGLPFSVVGNVPIISRVSRKDMFGSRLHSDSRIAGVDYEGEAMVEFFEGLTCFSGEPGTGKTYAMVETAYVFHKLGWDVITNSMNLTFEAGSYHDFDALCNLIDSGAARRTVICLDEAPSWANSRRWDEFPSGLFLKLQQVRKYGFLFLFTAINFDKVDKNLRDQTYHLWVCKKSAWTNTFIRALTVPSELQVAWERPRYKMRVRPRAEVVNAYQTHGFITAPRGSAPLDPVFSGAPIVCYQCGALLQSKLDSKNVETAALPANEHGCAFCLGY